MNHIPSSVGGLLFIHLCLNDYSNFHKVISLFVIKARRLKWGYSRTNRAKVSANSRRTRAPCCVLLLGVAMTTASIHLPGIQLTNVLDKMCKVLQWVPALPTDEQGLSWTDPVSSWTQQPPERFFCLLIWGFLSCFFLLEEICHGFSHINNILGSKNKGQF